MEKAAYPKFWQWAGCLIAGLLLSGCASSPPPATSSADSLTTISNTQTLKLGYREDSAPFSYKSPTGQPAGYSVEVCKRVADSIKSQLKLAKLDIQWVPVTAGNRFDMVTNGNVDLECGSTSRTLGREERVNFSLGTFVEGGSFISLAATPLRRVKELNGRKLGVVPGTTTDASVKTLASRGISPQIVHFATHTEGIAALREKRIDAYATDRLILMGEAILGQSGNFVLADEYISLEVYGLVMRRDANFSLAVNRALAQMYRSGEIANVLQQVFGNRAAPSNLLEAMFVLNAIPE
ncbi:MAG TPA: amino acid ABC transporter substrate-binding protein [Burkholderiales bacterium]|nr:amino acid ABC transporter substrate-binding protein [Burkholderiales bacterium]